MIEDYFGFSVITQPQKSHYKQHRTQLSGQKLSSRSRSHSKFKAYLSSTLQPNREHCKVNQKRGGQTACLPKNSMKSRFDSKQKRNLSQNKSRKSSYSSYNKSNLLLTKRSNGNAHQKHHQVRNNQRRQSSRNSRDYSTTSHSRSYNTYRCSSRNTPNYQWFMKQYRNYNDQGDDLNPLKRMKLETENRARQQYLKSREQTIQKNQKTLLQQSKLSSHSILYSKQSQAKQVSSQHPNYLSTSLTPQIYIYDQSKSFQQSSFSGKKSTQEPILLIPIPKKRPSIVDNKIDKKISSEINSSSQQIENRNTAKFCGQQSSNYMLQLDTNELQSSRSNLPSLGSKSNSFNKPCSYKSLLKKRQFKSPNQTHSLTKQNIESQNGSSQIGKCSKIISSINKQPLAQVSDNLSEGNGSQLKFTDRNSLNLFSKVIQNRSQVQQFKDKNTLLERKIQNARKIDALPKKQDCGSKIKQEKQTLFENCDYLLHDEGGFQCNNTIKSVIKHTNTDSKLKENKKATQNKEAQFNLSKTQSSKLAQQTQDKKGKSIKQIEIRKNDLSMDPIQLQSKEVADQLLPVKCRFSISHSVQGWNLLENVQRQSWTINKSELTNELLIQILEKIDLHLVAVNSIVQFVKMVDEIYDEEQTDWAKIPTFMVYKKFYLQRIKIVRSLKGDFSQGSCFNLQNLQITPEMLKPFVMHQEIKRRLQTVERCNKAIKKSLQDYYDHLKEDPQRAQNVEVNMDLFDDRNVGVLMSQANAQMEALMPKLQELRQEDFEQVEIVMYRSFKIMELVFLLSQLQGRRVKKMEEDIELNHFQDYYEQNYPIYRETIIYFN